MLRLSLLMLCFCQWSCRTAPPGPNYGGRDQLTPDSGTGGSNERVPPGSTVQPVENPLVEDELLIALCSDRHPSRSKAEAQLASYPLGQSNKTVAMLSASQEACVAGLLPAALFTNLKTGIPAIVLVAQAIQETGWCKSDLAQKAQNFHGQKASFDKKHFTYWDGAAVDHSSSESETGDGSNVIVSTFMKFDHWEYSFYSAAERFQLPGSPYAGCLDRKDSPNAFLKCIGAIWAVDQNYVTRVQAHFSFYLEDLQITMKDCKL
ncbi:MAG: glucosaminidase domain-containing protein [Pseudobacteriovorax sp.]|nr:glucosaminidase domain-containing protein [Pseudobacteriovorax sp.]